MHKVTSSKEKKIHIYKIDLPPLPPLHVTQNSWNIIMGKHFFSMKLSSQNKAS